MRLARNLKTVSGVVGSSHANLAGRQVTDYSAHHEPFQYYVSTANPHHLGPVSVALVGHTDRANHQYDLSGRPVRPLGGDRLAGIAGGCLQVIAGGIRSAWGDCLAGLPAFRSWGV